MQLQDPPSSLNLVIAICWTAISPVHNVHWCIHSNYLSAQTISCLRQRGSI